MRLYKPVIRLINRTAVTHLYGALEFNIIINFSCNSRNGGYTFANNGIPHSHCVVPASRAEQLRSLGVRVQTPHPPLLGRCGYIIKERV